MKRPNGVRAAYAAFLLHVLLLALVALSRPQYFSAFNLSFAAAIWLVLLKHINTLRVAIIGHIPK